MSRKIFSTLEPADIEVPAGGASKRRVLVVSGRPQVANAVVELEEPFYLVPKTSKHTSGRLRSLWWPVGRLLSAVGSSFSAVGSSFSVGRRLDLDGIENINETE